MSDPNYEHEFMPNRKGTCKRIVSAAHCGEREDFPAHVRWVERHPEPEVCEGTMPVTAPSAEPVTDPYSCTDEAGGSKAPRPGHGPWVVNEDRILDAEGQLVTIVSGEGGLAQDCVNAAKIVESVNASLVDHALTPTIEGRRPTGGGQESCQHKPKGFSYLR